MKFKLTKPSDTSDRTNMGRNWSKSPRMLFVYLHNSVRSVYVESACRCDGITGFRLCRVMG